MSHVVLAKEMVVCQYFLRGTCKFGSSCRNDHPTGGAGFGKSSSFGTFSKSQHGSAGSFGRWQGSAGNADNDATKIINSIKQEVLLWERSKMWLFSCFSHPKEAPPFAGLLDYSPEELRLEAYKAKESGTSDEFIKNLKQIDSQFASRRSELKSLTLASWEQEKQRLSGQSSSGLFANKSSSSSLFSGPSLLFSSQPAQSSNSNLFATTKQNLFGGSMGQSAFGQQSGSMLGSTQQSSFGSGGTSLFASPSVFGSSQQSSVFGANQQSSFGGAQPNAFGGTHQSAFGGAQTSSFSGGQQSSLFGGGQQPLFGGTQSTSGGTQQTAFGAGQQPVFGGRPQSVNGGGLFSQVKQPEQQKNTGLFTQENLFGQNSQQQSNLFGQTALQTAFAQPSQAANSRTAESSNPFLQAAMLNKQQETVDEMAEIATELKLSETDLLAYKADRFLLGQVPECPPPPELC